MKRFVIAAVIAMLAVNAQAAKRYIVLSDSIFTQSYGTVRPHKLAFNIVNSNTSAIFTVFGSPGATVSPAGGYTGMADMLPAVELWKGRLGANGAYIQAGTNEHGQSVPLETYKASMRTLISGLQGMSLGVMCIKPMWKASQNTANAEGLVLADYQQAMVEVCGEYGAPVLTFNAVSTDFVDGLHLSEAGHQKFADWFINIGVYLGAWTRVTTTTTAKR